MAQRQRPAWIVVALVILAACSAHAASPPSAIPSAAPSPADSRFAATPAPVTGQTDSLSTAAGTDFVTPAVPNRASLAVVAGLRSPVTVLAW